MGIIAVALRCIGNGDGPEGFNGAPLPFPARQTGLVSGCAFGHLASDGHDGVEGGHRFLKDHGDLTAADTAQGGEWLVKQIQRLGVAVAAPEDSAGNRCRESEQTKNGKRRCTLAGAGLAHEPEHFAIIDVKIDAANGFGCAKTNAKIVSFNERRHMAMVATGRKPPARQVPRLLCLRGSSPDIHPVKAV